ncbi:hypothetical protein [Veillonella sp. 3310]|uniref:hypothetical protein n=1 Tax=Veillonella sp. 3310 TaxID=2490956 RepID=UPI000FD64914|nr:hypothetical protein [Veillonella sp. 3310]
MKVLSCNYFGANETIYFNVKRLAELETAIGKPIMSMMSTGNLSLFDMIHVYIIGMQHIDNGRRTQDFYEEKIQELIDSEEYELTDFIQTAVKVLLASGVFGKKAYYSAFPNEVTPTVEKKIAEEEAEAESKN